MIPIVKTCALFVILPGKFSAVQIMMSPHIRAIKKRGGNNRMNSMLTLLLQSSIFIAGFLVGYAARARRSHRHRTHYVTLAPRTTFGHPRRAF
jgi:hypothetical protein